MSSERTHTDSRSTNFNLMDALKPASKFTMNLLNTLNPVTIVSSLGTKSQRRIRNEREPRPRIRTSHRRRVPPPPLNTPCSTAEMKIENDYEPFNIMDSDSEYSDSDAESDESQPKIIIVHRIRRSLYTIHEESESTLGEDN